MTVRSLEQPTLNQLRCFYFSELGDFPFESDSLRMWCQQPIPGGLCHTAYSQSLEMVFKREVVFQVYAFYHKPCQTGIAGVQHLERSEKFRPSGI